MSETVNKARWFFIGGWVTAVATSCIRGPLAMFANLWDPVREAVSKGNRLTATSQWHSLNSLVFPILNDTQGLKLYVHPSLVFI